MSPPNQAKPVTSPWKNKKGPAPARPIPLRRPVKEMPMEDINTELTDIEVRQQELERQGVQLEQSIREKTEEGIRLELSSINLHFLRRMSKTGCVQFVGKDSVNTV